jgi:hypothetical protein
MACFALRRSAAPDAEASRRWARQGADTDHDRDRRRPALDHQIDGVNSGHGQHCIQYTGWNLALRGQ